MKVSSTLVTVEQVTQGGLRSCCPPVMVDSWLGHLYIPPTSQFRIMSLSKSFPPADDLIEQLQQVDYQKLAKDVSAFVITVAAFVAAIATLLWKKIQVMKFQTPTFCTEYFYFGVNMIGEPGDEIVGLSVGNRYIGLYSNGIAWGVLNEQGALDS